MKLRDFKEDIKTFYLSGLNATEIALKLNSRIIDTNMKIKKESVQKYIQRNLLMYKRFHDIKVIERKESIKAVNYEAKRHMTDKAFIMKNRSIYKTKANGDIVLNKTIAPAVTWDTPRRLSNENKIS